ncbi:MAG: PhzF family phenazine biosynthesis protein [Acidimicrobiia bacterium]|nr:PhzF family phenazine biosynthesis protein [Acidimicrobiia bacterium]MBT8215954.1 PhzF family phenazine biosynthesis protein [Acidimicrobiia bacterium]NNF08695.1 PhzF family phenazine biosynthesis protein [Acidimicrobiia bacterium]NNL98636.1 PhzF family phenazine biosynthesis protein [Acidimicrobiia bacterium]
MDPQLLRSAAFDAGGEGGNPAGVWIGDALPSSDEMQRIAAEVGYSETAFNERVSDHRWTTRYYSPEAEVSFCGHATIATGVALGERYGTGRYELDTAVGPVSVDVSADAVGRLKAVLTSVEPQTRPLARSLLESVLGALRWSRSRLDPTLPPGLAYAGAWHLILPVDRETLASLDYEFDALKALMLEHDLTTIQIIVREQPALFHSRNPFPVGGVVEDPATGAAAAALGAYLRDRGEVSPPADLVIHQGFDMGRPSILDVHIPTSGGIRVGGTAAAIDGYD